MGRSKELFQQYRDGEIGLLDATLKLREIRKDLEAEIAEIKAFEYENLQAYEEYKGEVYKGYTFAVSGGGASYSYKNISEIKDLEAKYKMAHKGAMAGTVQVTTDEEGNKFWIDQDGEMKPFPEVTYRKQFLMIRKTKK